MSAIRVQLASPQIRKSAKLFAETVRCLLGALVAVNRITLKSDSSIPPLYKANVVYKREPKGQETFNDITVIRYLGHGDCAHLAAWRVAELRNSGENADLRIAWKVTRRGKRLFHVQVRRADGRIEDPSKLLGMGTIE
jgi:hypothetical protein